MNDKAKKSAAKACGCGANRYDFAFRKNAVWNFCSFYLKRPGFFPGDDCKNMSAEGYLKLVSSGGAEAERGLKGLFDLYAARIKGFFRRQGCNDEDAADLLQETFVKVVRGAPAFRFDSQVSTWIWTIARNCLNDHWRSRHDTESLDEMKEADRNAWENSMGVSEPEHELTEMKDCVRKAFFDFAERHPENAQATMLATVEGWTMEELAKTLGRTAGATCEFVSQCRKKLRPYLERCREFLPSKRGAP